jgi:D-alanyl-D-alanine carboxypeptidase (penicillin-binding protein 5/6)
MKTMVPFRARFASCRRYCLLIMVGCLGLAGVAQAQDRPLDAQTAAAPITDGRFAAAIVIDADTGDVLLSKEPHARRQPASMLKMMTELIVLEKIARREIGMGDSVTVSARASKMGGSQVYLKHGERFTVEELLMALAIHSANDASASLAEYVSGSIPAFIDLMNLRARELNLQETEFHSVHGLPPARDQQPDLTSAFDMAMLAHELIKHPESLHWSAMATAPFRGGEFTLYNPNKLIGKFRGLDGLKTGYHDQAGYCVTATALQNGKRLISVVMGAPSNEARATETTRLLSYGFNLYAPVTVVAEGRTPLDLKLEVKGGKKRDVTLAMVGPLVVSVRKDQSPQVVIQPRLPESIDAPVAENLEVGKGLAVLQGQVLGEVPIVTLEEVPKGNWLQRLFH